MSEERKKSVWPWIVALLIGLPVLYVASFGPACWWYQKTELSAPTWRSDVLDYGYGYLWWASMNGPQWFQDGMGWYLDWWTPSP